MMRDGRMMGLMLALAAGVITLLAACTEAPKSSGTRSALYVVEGGVGGGKQWRDTREVAERVQVKPLAEDGIHDPTNDALRVLQEPADAMSAFPMDRRGAVDWVRALELGLIQPRADLPGTAQMVVMDMDILFKDTGQMPWVRFPHQQHTEWLDCSNCHPDIFIPHAGANNPSMDGILAGEHCGRCHDKVAFPLWVCERCHNVPHAGSPEKWW